MKPGHLQDLLLYAHDAIPSDRMAEGGAFVRGFAVDLVPAGDVLPAVVVHGTTAAEAGARAREVLAALRLRRTGT